MSLNAAIVSGLLLSLTMYSRSPILAVPAGMIRFWLPMAALTSDGDRPCANSAPGSRLTIIWRSPPPPGWGPPRPLDGAELLVDEVLGVVEDLLLAQGVAADGDLHDGHAGGAVADNERRGDSRR